jgi:hypothetical protein
MELVVMIVLGLIVAGYVLIPFERSRRAVAYDWDGTGATSLRDDRRAELETEVRDYRQALKAGTLCARCGMPNAAGSRFCGECGRPLPGPRATEAEPEPVSG